MYDGAGVVADVRGRVRVVWCVGTRIGTGARITRHRRRAARERRNDDGCNSHPPAPDGHANLDYRALSNAGCWWIGRLQTDADRERVVEGLAGLDGGEGVDASALGESLKRLAPRWFVMRDVHRKPAMALMQTRWTFTWMRGPMTRAEIRNALPRAGAQTAVAKPAAVSGGDLRTQEVSHV
jgi:hypothetical protein